MKTYRTDTPPDTQRRKLMLSLPGGFAMASPLALLACGGGDDAAVPSAAPAAPAAPVLPAFKRSAVPVRVQLPAGMSMALESTSLMTGNNVSQVAPDGRAAAVLIEGEPQMSYLFAADGRLLLMGAIEAGRPMLDSRTTAEALIYIASEVALLEPALRIALRLVLRTHAIVDPVRVAVEAALLRSGITDEDPQLMAALIAAESVVRRRQPVASAQAASRMRAQKVTFDSADTVSGVRVKRASAFNTVVFENTFRRRAHAWVEQTGYFTATGVQQNLPAPRLLKEFDISATTALSFDNLVVKVGDFLSGLASDIGLIGDYQQGTVSFAPVTSDPVFLPIEPDNAQSSLYRTRVVGVGVPLAPGEVLTPAESQKYDELLVATVWEDIVVPTLQTLVLPLISDRLGKAFEVEVKKLWLAAIAVDVVNVAFLTPLLPNTLDRVRAGDADGALGAFYKEFFTSNVFQDLLKNSLTALAIAGVGADFTASPGLDFAGVALPSKFAQFTTGLSKAVKVIAYVKAAATVVDFVALAKDWASSSKRSEFALSSSGTTIAFTPAAVSATPSQSVPLTATLGETQDLAAGTVVRYEWSVSGSAGGSLRNPTNQSTGATISTSTNTVDYVAAAGAAVGATDQVSVKTFLTDIATQAGGVIAVSMVPAVVTISAVRMTPLSVDFKRLLGGQRQDFSVEFDKAFGPSGLVFEWSCASLYGFISDNTIFSSSAAPKFRSTLSKVTYSSGAAAVGGETEAVKVRVLRITSAPGAVTETTETVATLESTVRYSNFEVAISPSQADVPTDTSFSMSGIVKDALPPGSTVSWAWALSGVGSLGAQTLFNVSNSCIIDFSTGAVEGAAIITVRATVVVPGSPPRTVVSSPVSAALTVKKGLRTIVIEGNWVYEPGTKPFAQPSCGFDGQGKQVCNDGYLDDWVVYQIPKVANALSYTIRLLNPRGGELVAYGYPNGRFASSVQDGGSLLRIKYWALDTPYGSYDGVSDYAKVEAAARAYLLSRVAAEAPRVVATVTLRS